MEREKKKVIFKEECQVNVETMVIKKNSNFSPLPNVTSDSRNNHNGDPWVKD